MKNWWFFVLAGYILAAVTQAGLASRETIPSAVVAQPTATPSVAPPSRLIIPALQVDTEVEQVANDDEGRMAVPHNPVNVGWYKPGVKPGEEGRAVIDGHLDTPTGPSVFWGLSKLKPGDEIIITDETGKNHTFIVYDSKIYPDADFPILDVFGSDPLKKLNLITCNGVFDNNTKNYSSRLVVFAILKDSP